MDRGVRGVCHSETMGQNRKSDKAIVPVPLTVEEVEEYRVIQMTGDWGVWIQWGWGHQRDESGGGIDSGQHGEETVRVSRMIRPKSIRCSDITHWERRVESMNHSQEGAMDYGGSVGEKKINQIIRRDYLDNG